MNFIQAAGTALRHKGMPEAYSRWIVHRILGLSGPYIKVGLNARVGRNWECFSEYWSNLGSEHGPRCTISTAEDRLMTWRLAEADGKSTAVDVGANIGVFSVALASAGFSEVHSFEPVPETFARLKQNIALNQFDSKIVLNSLGLSNQEGEAQISYDPRSPATAHVSAQRATSESSVHMTTLDHYAEKMGLCRIDFLKIDTEGYETSVFRGAENLLRRKQIGFVLLEWCPELLTRSGSSPEELWQTLKNFGYSLRLVRETGQLDDRLTLDQATSLAWSNLAAVPDSSEL